MFGCDVGQRQQLLWNITGEVPRPTSVSVTSPLACLWRPWGRQACNVALSALDLRSVALHVRRSSIGLPS